MGWNRAALSEHREKRVIGKMITPLRQEGLGLPFLWECFLLEAALLLFGLWMLESTAQYKVAKSRLQ